MAPSPEVKQAVDRFIEAFNGGQPEAVDNLIASTQAVLGIGSDPDEWWAGRDRLLSVQKAQLKEMGGAHWELSDAIGGERWMAARCTVTTSDGEQVPGRLTVVCTKDGKIEHYHFSIGVPNEEAIKQKLPT
jgi:hypothetical protein